MNPKIALLIQILHSVRHSRSLVYPLRAIRHLLQCKCYCYISEPHNYVDICCTEWYICSCHKKVYIAMIISMITTLNAKADSRSYRSLTAPREARISRLTSTHELGNTNRHRVSLPPTFQFDPGPRRRYIEEVARKIALLIIWTSEWQAYAICYPFKPHYPSRRPSPLLAVSETPSLSQDPVELYSCH